MDLQLVKGLDKLGIKVIHNVAAAPVKGLQWRYGLLLKG